MRVLHVPFTWFPDPAGGTEHYVHDLSLALAKHGVESAVAAPGREAREDVGELGPVFRFEVPDVAPSTFLEEVYGVGSAAAAESFARILDRAAPDVVHLHSYTRAASLLAVEACRRRGTPVAFTYHTPTVSCGRGTLMRWGAEVCDGLLDARACAECVLQQHGVPRAAAPAARSLGQVLGGAVGGAGLAGGAWTALRLPGLTTSRIAALRAFLDRVDRIVVLCQWSRDLLLRNGVAPEKVLLSRHGLAASPDVRARRARAEGGPLKAAFLGRVDPAKGLDVLVAAIRGAPDLSIRLDVFGICQGREDEKRLSAFQDALRGDRRVEFRAPLSHGEVLPALAEYDILLVPSRWLETGPLVVLEAFAAGVPVIGSRLGGIEELVEDGVNGLLVPPQDALALREALRRAAAEPGLLEELAAGVRPPRSAAAVAADMMGLYRELVDSGRAAPVAAFAGPSHGGSRWGVIRARPSEG